MKTAVEWLVKEVESISNSKIESKEEMIKLYNEAITKAKEMEKNNYICSKCKCSLYGKDMQQMQDKENT